jgi:hypothetical protein
MPLLDPLLFISAASFSACPAGFPPGRNSWLEDFDPAGSSPTKCSLQLIPWEFP